MDIFLDDCLIDDASITDQTLAEALRHIQETLCAPGRVVATLRCDGQDVSGDRMTAALENPVSSMQQLEIFTSTVEELVGEAMEQASASLTQMESECGRISDSLTEGRSAEGMQALGECVTVLQQVHEAIIKSTQMLKLDVENTRIHDEPLVNLLTKPTDVLKQIKSALQSQDHVLLADTLKYEVAEVTDHWHTVMTFLRDRVEAQRDTATPPTETARDTARPDT